ncbi:hypothetical protein BSKO_01575 [Bryopsis sp. KO-2023]|nr:hypothetical protein BSKO_01575 [Bryopsis sp. KO-2023]
MMGSEVHAYKRTVELRDGCKIAVHDFGGVGPQLVILHANGFHAWAYVPMILHLRESFRCYGIDLRAAGDSDRGTVPLVPKEFGHDVIEIIDKLRMRGCCVFGHSLGGASALVAQSYDPTLFEAMYLYEAVVTSSKEKEAAYQKESPAQKLAEMALRRKNAFASAQEAVSHLSKKPPFSRFHDLALQHYVGHGLLRPKGSEVMSWKCDVKDEAEIFRTFTPMFTDSAKFDRPMSIARGTVAVGAHAHLQEAAGAMAAMIPSAELKDFEGLGHLGPFEDPEAVARSVLEFFSKLDRQKQYREHSRL